MNADQEKQTHRGGAETRRRKKLLQEKPFEHGGSGGKEFFWQFLLIRLYPC
jgi:hypothetical protein